MQGGSAAPGRPSTHMKILFCNYEYPPLGGGGGVVMAALARQLGRRHEVTVLTSRAAQLPAQSIDQNVRVIRVPVFFRRQLAVANFASMLAYLPAGFARGCTLARGSFDVLNTHFVVPTGPLGHALARWHGVPNVLSVHGGDLFDPSKRSSPHRHAVLRAAVRSMLRNADAVVGQSRDTTRHVGDIYGVRRNVELIPLGIERPPPQPHVSRESLGLPLSAFVLVTVGRLVARKATAQLVDILAASALPDVFLLIVGDGPDAEPIRQRAAALGVSRQVRLLGQVPEQQKHAALSVADVFVCASQHEGFGLVFLEAMAFGLPIICYDRGGQTDFLATGATGHVVPLNDRESFTRALRDLHDNVAARKAIGAGNRLRVNDYFIDTCADRYEALFDRVVARAAGSTQERRPVLPSG